MFKRQMLKLLCLMLVLVFGFNANAFGAIKTNGKRAVIYFPNWGTYSAARSNLTVGMIPWEKVDVINHAFFTVDSQYNVVSTDTFADFEKQFEHSGDWTQKLKGHMGEYKYYKSKYPNKKVLISIGGWTRGENFHAMAASAQNRAKFIGSVIELLKQHPFIDGVDIYWEYPGIDRKRDVNDEYDRGCPGGPEDKKNFTVLLKEVREAYSKNGMTDKMLTIAASAGYEKLQLQEPNVYQQYLDFINVMTYDMHGAWEKITNNHSPIYANSEDPSPTTPVDIKNKYNTEAALKVFTGVYGIPASKLNVGTPYYSRGWKNVDGATGHNGLFAKADGAPVGNLDNPSSPGGQNSYTELKRLEKTAGWTKYRDEKSKVPYLYNPSLKIMYSYEDEQSLGERCDYVNKNGYGGIIVWDISCDDIHGYPMTSVINKKFGCNTNDGSNNNNNKVPEAASLSVEKPNDNGNYTVNISIPANNTATAMKLFENGKEVKSQTINAAAVAAKKIAYVVNGKAKGIYEYRCDLTNKYGTTSSAVLTVTVGNNNNNNNNAEWKTNTKYSAGQLVKYQGKTYKCWQGHQSMPGWEPDKVPALWQLQ